MRIQAVQADGAVVLICSELGPYTGQQLKHLLMQAIASTPPSNASPPSPNASPPPPSAPPLLSDDEQYQLFIERFGLENEDPAAVKQGYERLRSTPISEEVPWHWLYLRSGWQTLLDLCHLSGEQLLLSPAGRWYHQEEELARLEEYVSRVSGLNLKWKVDRYTLFRGRFVLEDNDQTLEGYRLLSSTSISESGLQVRIRNMLSRQGMTTLLDPCLLSWENLYGMRGLAEITFAQLAETVSQVSGLPLSWKES